MGNWHVDSFQMNAATDTSSKKDTTQEITPKRHLRNFSDVLFTTTHSFSVSSPSGCKGTQPELSLQPKLSELEAENFRLQVELERIKRKNEDLQEVISAYDRKIAGLLSRTTDCMGRVIRRKNSEISRLEDSLNSKEEQFAAKLEAEAHRSKELETASSFTVTRRLEKTVSQQRDELARLHEDLKRLKVRAEVAEAETAEYRRREAAHLKQSKVLDDLGLQLAEVEQIQEALKKENATLRAAQRTCAQAGELKLLGGMIRRLRDLIESCRQGSLSQVLKGPGTTHLDSEQDCTRVIAQAKADVGEIETQLLTWYSALCGNECHIS